MRFLLDTNAVIALLNDAGSNLALRVRQHTPSDIGMSAIVSHELFYGAFKSQRAERNVALVDSLMFEVVDFDKGDSRRIGSAGVAYRPLRRADRRTGQGSELDPGVTQHTRVQPSAGAACRGLGSLGAAPAQALAI